MVLARQPLANAAFDHAHDGPEHHLLPGVVFADVRHVVLVTLQHFNDIPHPFVAKKIATALVKKFPQIKWISWLFLTFSGFISPETRRVINSLCIRDRAERGSDTGLRLAYFRASHYK